MENIDFKNISEIYNKVQRMFFQNVDDICFVEQLNQNQMMIFNNILFLHLSINRGLINAYGFENNN